MSLLNSWYCLKVIVGSEYKAERELNNYYPDRIYLPEIERDKRFRKKGKRQTKRITEPMFSGYLFANLSQDNDDWSNIAKCSAQIVKRGNFIPTIDDEFINDFKHYQQVMQTDYQKGDQVLINAPGFVNVPAIVTMSGKERVKVLMSFMGTERPATLSRYQIEPV